MLRYYICAICALGFLQLQTALACTVAPQHMYLPHDEAIEDAEWIVVAEAVRRTTKEVEFSVGHKALLPGYEMRVLEYIKGTGPDRIIIQNRDEHVADGHSKELSERNFYAHSVSSFWTNGGSHNNWPDCQIHPGFLFAGHRYLIFGPQGYQNGYENIAIKGDVWLRYVRDYVAGAAPEKPFPKTASDYFSEAKAIVRVQAQWNGTSATWDMDILKGSDENYMHMVYVSPSAAFDQLLNPACDDQFILRRKPEKIDFLYVFERLPEKAINVSQSLECVGEKFDEWGSMRARGVFAPNSYQVFDIVDGYIIPPQHRNPQLDLVSDDIGSDALKLENIITALTP